MKIKTNWADTAVCLLAICFLAGTFAPNKPVTSTVSSDITEPQSRNSFHIQVLFPPTPVLVAGTTQLVYELHLTNFTNDTLTLVNVQVIDAVSETVLAEFRETALEALLGRPGPDQPTNESRIVAPGRRAIVYFNLPVNGTRVPDRLIHHIEFSVMTNKGRQRAVAKGGPVEINKVSPPELGPPLHGGPWVAVYNPSWQRGHRRVFYAFGGRASIQGRFAIDWMKAEERQSATPDNDSHSANMNGLGADVLAVADAVVVDVRDNVERPEDCADHAPLAPEDHAGNYVALKLSDGRYIFYEHLQPDIPIQPGDRVRRGQVIAALGCTGSTTRPHLHIHVGNARSSFSEGLPYLLTSAQVLGVYDSIEDFNAGTAWREFSPESDVLPNVFFPVPMMVVQFPEE